MLTCLCTTSLYWTKHNYIELCLLICFCLDLIKDRAIIIIDHIFYSLFAYQNKIQGICLIQTFHLSTVQQWPLFVRPKSCEDKVFVWFRHSIFLQYTSGHCVSDLSHTKTRISFVIYWDRVVRYWLLINNKAFNTVFNKQISYSIEMY